VLDDRGVRGGTELGFQPSIQDWFEACWTAWYRPRCHRPGIAAQPQPAFDGRWIEIEVVGNLMTRDTTIDGSQRFLAQIGGIGFHAASLPQGQPFRRM